MNPERFSSRCDKALLLRDIEALGADGTTVLAMEELSECAAALGRYRFRGRGSALDVAEEIADVWITLEEIVLLLGGMSFWREVMERRRRKLERLKEILESRE